MQDLGRDFQAQSMKFLFWLVMVLGKAEVKNQRYDGCGNSGTDMDCPFAPWKGLLLPAALCLRIRNFSLIQGEK